jgi:thiamine-phosphate pyrophosphorylase
MIPELTPAVSRALSAARQWARRLGMTEADAGHVLLGLLDEEEGRIAVLLQRQGLYLDAVRAGLLGGQPATLPAPPAEEVPDEQGHGYAVVHLLREARHRAQELAGESIIASEHLLLALLQENEAQRRILEGLGFDVQALETHVRGENSPRIALVEPLEIPALTEQVDLARILDANANRAREALRVVEDHCRFVLDDAFLSRELKNLRHDLTAALAEFPAPHFLAARDTLGDVGTHLSTPAEEERGSLRAVVQANLKRLQEALRTLEEYGKLHQAELGRKLEGLRYRAYTLERALVLGGDARQRLAEARLQVLVTASRCQASLERTVKEAVAGGAQIIQLREKRLTDRDLLARARQVRQWAREGGALFIVNDRPDIARLAEADGVHVGQEELPVKEVRRIVGPDALVGVSTHDLEQARQAIRAGASYLGVGPIFPSGTKAFAHLAGLEFVRQIAAETSCPAFAIGGIDLNNVQEVVSAGIRRVAVSQAVCRSDDPRASAAALRQILNME